MADDRRVLIIDDDQSMLRLIKTRLGAAGYNVEGASDGETGLRLVHEFRPRMVILDLLLPGIDGFVVCRRIREDPTLSGITIVMMTAVYLSEEDMVQGFRIGADDYLVKPDVILSKPLHLKELVETVDSVFALGSAPAPYGPVKDRIMVVDDDEKNLRLLKMRFASEGFSVREMDNGQKALDGLEDYQPHLVLLDIKMPGMSGLDVLKEIRHREYDFPVVMMTAHGSEAIAVEAFEYGADDYFIKPFDTAQGARRVTHLIERHRLKKSRDQLTERLKKISCDLVNQVNHLEIQNQRLEEAYAKVRGLSEFNQRFIKSLSQELRAPLAMILSFLSLLRDTSEEQRDPERETETLATLFKTAFRLELTLSNLLYISRAQADILKVVPGAIEVEPAMEELLRLAEKSLGDEGIRITWYPERKTHRVEGDATLFHDIVINLLHNSIHRMEGKGEVVLEFLEASAPAPDRPAGENRHRLRVRDSGSWFSEQELTTSNVKDLNPESMKEGSEHIRLNLCRHLADIMGWSLELTNRPAGGCEMILDMVVYEE